MMIVVIQKSEKDMEHYVVSFPLFVMVLWLSLN